MRVHRLQTEQWREVGWKGYPSKHRASWLRSESNKSTTRLIIKMNRMWHGHVRVCLYTLIILQLPWGFPWSSTWCLTRRGQERRPCLPHCCTCSASHGGHSNQKLRRAAWRTEQVQHMSDEMVDRGLDQLTADFGLICHTLESRLLRHPKMPEKKFVQII